MKFSRMTYLSLCLWPACSTLFLAPSIAADLQAVPAIPISCSHNIAHAALHLRGAEFTGQVLLEAKLDETGQIEKIDILSSEPRGYFERIVLRAAEHWHFKQSSTSVVVRIKTISVPRLDLSQPSCDEVRIIDGASLSGEENIAFRTFLNERRATSGLD